jgi:hypothetical protein
MRPTTLTILSAAMVAMLSACASHSMKTPMVDNMALPEAVRVPAGEKQAMWTKTSGGQITYECREKSDAAGQYAWAFVGPVATLNDAGGKAVGKYFGPPTTWQSNDGSTIGGKQVAVAPNATGNIPLQLVKTEGATGSGAMSKVTHIQRLKTKGGVAPAASCAMANKGDRQIVEYSADYVFYTR